ncbi:unnamed protein product [Colias eurytheme]|nr:unnamed protein product [Colias eurytheme]
MLSGRNVRNSFSDGRVANRQVAIRRKYVDISMREDIRNNGQRYRISLMLNMGLFVRLSYGWKVLIVVWGASHVRASCGARAAGKARAGAPRGRKARGRGGAGQPRIPARRRNSLVFRARVARKLNAQKRQ